MTSTVPPAPFPPPPKRPTLQLLRLFDIQPTLVRWPSAVRTALCMGILTVAGWAAGDLAAGLVATLGAFTVLYGSDRPYRHRAILLAWVALGFAGTVSLGIVVDSLPVVVVVATIVAIAAVSTFFCNALTVGPPGAYMFALTCAVGTALPTQHLSIATVALLVLAGGGLSWCLQMMGALVEPRGPEIAAVKAAASAVIRFAESIGTIQHDELRHSTAQTLHDAWTQLVAFQPLRPHPESTLSQLRAANRELHQIFARSVDATLPERDALATQARELAARVASAATNKAEAVDVPLGRHSFGEALRESLRPNSPEWLATIRVTIAAALTGAAGAMLGLEHAYWAIASAVLVLHQGLDWTRTLQRSADRIIGTLAGLMLAGGILWFAPQGLWLAAVIVALQFIIELFVVRNYAIAVVFITAIAMIIATGGMVTPDVGHLLWARGADTVIGCLIGLAVHVAVAPRWSTVPVPLEIVRTLGAINTPLGFLALGDVTSRKALQARRDLQHRTIMLLKAYDAGIGAATRHRQMAERQWPVVVATQRLAYRVLAACWMIEEAGPNQAAARAATLFADSDVTTAQQAVSKLAAAVEAGEAGKPAELPAALPAFLDVALRALANSIVSER